MNFFPSGSSQDIRATMDMRYVMKGGILYEAERTAGNDVRRVVASRAGAKSYYVSVVNGKVTERVLEPEMIS